MQHTIDSAKVATDSIRSELYADKNRRWLCPPIERDFPVARYRAEFWESHAVLVQSSKEVVEMAVKSLEKEVTFQRGVRLDDPDTNEPFELEPGNQHDSRLYYASLVGLVAPTRDLVSKGADTKTVGGY